ncbi:hypothetical protein [Actinoplanes regularis]|uniref:hypothetical protein n=1 Tax=Actinoplanes regularis TaxID=52697 RepID=UPI0024A01B16|nr:hypothetical protein [Actinoplanes regularis]GLW28300.1 hypothetical protein Areg01_12400 [Actinoplanes regularis]
MDNDVEWVADGDRVAFFGDPDAVRAFLAREGLWEASTDFGPRLRAVLGAAGTVAQEGSEIAAGSFRWVKLTEVSANLQKQFGFRHSKSGLPTGVIKGVSGRIRKIVEFEKGPGSLLNPATISGIGGVMAQLALQQALAEITAYLARIEEKADDILARQDDSELARLYGISVTIDRALTIRNAGDEPVKDLPAPLWSTVQHGHETINTAQGVAISRLQRVIKKMEARKSVRAAAKALPDSRQAVREWLTVLARCRQMQDALDVLELDQALRESPDRLDAYRQGMQAHRQTRQRDLEKVTETLLARLVAVARRADAKVLLLPEKSPAVVAAINQIIGDIHALQESLGIVSGHEAQEPRQWREAANDVKVKAGIVTDALVEVTKPHAPKIAVAALFVLEAAHGRVKKP